MRAHLPRREKAKELEASAWLFSSSGAETVGWRLSDEVLMFSVWLEYVPSRCPQGCNRDDPLALCKAVGTQHDTWDSRSAHTNQINRRYVRVCSSVQLAFSQRRSCSVCSVWEGVGKVKLLICSVVIHSVIQCIQWFPLKTLYVSLNSQQLWTDESKNWNLTLAVQLCF